MKRDAFGRRLSPLVRPALSAKEAAWLEGRLLPWGKEQGTRVCSVVPLGFETYSRILHPAFGPPPDRPPIRWVEIGERLLHTVGPETQWESLEELVKEAGSRSLWHEEPWMGRCPPEVLVPLSEHLQRYTETSSAIYYAMWVGFADVQSVIRKAPRFELPAREYALLTGPIAALPSIIESTSPYECSPSLAWPEDRAWCLATEVDFRWTYVGAAEECIQSLEADRRLEAIRTEPQHRGDLESDWRRDQ
jgi:hypothetical protein